MAPPPAAATETTFLIGALILFYTLPLFTFDSENFKLLLALEIYLILLPSLPDLPLLPLSPLPDLVLDLLLTDDLGPGAGVGSLPDLLWDWASVQHNHLIWQACRPRPRHLLVRVTLGRATHPSVGWGVTLHASSVHGSGAGASSV